MMRSTKPEYVQFADVLIDRSFPHEGLPTRKPGVGLFGKYLGAADYDLKQSYVIGDRITDRILSKSGRRNSFHSVTIHKASAPSRAS